MAWRHDVDIEYISATVNIINVWCYSDPSNAPLLLSCIYGPSKKNNRPRFWDSLLDMGVGYHGPWMCIGDFHMILSQSDKFGGRLYACSSNDAFHGFLATCGMIDLGFSGNPFTWSNKRMDHHLIKECLDRGIANPFWVHLFPHFFVRHLPAQSSDHNPIILDTTSTDLSLPRPFRFEEFWTYDSTCGSVISSAWNPCFPGSLHVVLSKNIKATKSALRSWNHHHFGNIQRRISSTLLQLDLLQQSPPSTFSLDQEVLLQKSLDDLLLQE